MRKLLLSLVLICHLTGQVFAQRDSLLPNVVPPTPNAAAIEKFGNNPVDISTGIPEISNSLWSWKRRKLSLELALRYHAGGHKVDDIASNTGLGWTLSGLPQVSRTVRGLSDDNYTKGFMYTPVLPQASTYAYTGGFIYTSMYPYQQATFLANTAITPLNTSYSDSVVMISEKKLDGEQDIFSYSIGRKSGRFVISKDRVVMPLENTNLKFALECIPTTVPDGSAGYIIAVVITDDDGTVYRFDTIDFQAGLTLDDGDGIASPSFASRSGYLISTIYDPQTNDSINFHYSYGGNYIYESSFGESQVIDLGYSGDPMKFQISSDISNWTYLLANSINVSSIDFPDNSHAYFSYNFSRDDLKNTSGLTGVKVINSFGQTVKNWQLYYSYFLSGAGIESYSPVWSASGNDFNRRLRLDSLSEIANDSSDRKVTKFTYNGIKLNPRNSKNIDYWGYNVDPSRNNLTYLPEVPLEPDERVASGNTVTRLGGANRKPDSIYCKAALLERIDFPTGGFTNFTYECNRAFSAINYYEDSLLTGTTEWQQADFNVLQTFSFPGRLDTLVKFYFKTTEFTNPRPTADPNSPQSCLDNQQDLTPVKWIVKATDNSFADSLEDNYDQFIGGKYYVFNLPLNKTYRVQFVYNASASCAFMYPFKAQASAVYYTGMQNKLAGGVRVKKIESFDGLGGKLSKSYVYDSAGLSTAKVISIPDYGYYRTGTLHGPNTGQNFITSRQLRRTSSPTNTLTYFNGAPLVYTRVVEYNADSSYTVYKYDTADYRSNGGTGFYPYLPTQDFPNMSGMLLRRTVADKAGNIKLDERKTYQKNRLYYLNPQNRNLKAGPIAFSTDIQVTYYAADQFFMYKTIAVEDSTITTSYDAGVASTQITKKNFDLGTFYLRNVISRNSANDSLMTAYTYPTDYFDSISLALRAQNIVSPVIQVQTTKLPSSVLKTERDVYAKQGTVIAPAIKQSSIFNAALHTDVTLLYDDKGNIIQYTPKDSVPVCFFYAYQQQYPVAKVVGKTYADAKSQSGISLSVLTNPSNGAALKTELNKLTTLSNALVSTYDYKPLAGLTSETSVSGVTHTFEYDAFNRLLRIRDADRNILKQYEYKYAFQTYNAPAVWIATGNYRCMLTTEGYTTGHQEREERDTSGYSASYNTVRWVDAGTNTTACPITAAWIFTGTRRCQLNSVNQRTGHSERQEKDMNPYSPTYNTLRWIDEGVSPVCQ